MNLAVKLYASCPDAPKGMPPHWPAEVRELGHSTELPEGPWMLMTRHAYEAYRERFLQDYLIYEDKYDPKGRKPKTFLSQLLS